MGKEYTMPKIEPLEKPTPKKKAVASRGKQAATKANTEKLRKAALAEIEERIERLSAEDGNGDSRATLAHVAGGEGAGAESRTSVEDAARANVAQRTRSVNSKASRGKKKAEREAGADEEAPETAAAPKPKRVGVLDAAATVLAESDRPLHAKEIIDLVVERGLWSSPGGGKTPEATLYAAMIREIAAKGDEARFRKVERGLFVHADSPVVAKKAAGRKGA